MRLTLVGVFLVTALACSKSNNVFLGRVAATVAGHSVVVMDCYRTSVSQPRYDAANTSERWTPCRDADLAIRGAELKVNGQLYGPLSAGDRVTLDHGRVLVNDHPVPAHPGQ